MTLFSGQCLIKRINIKIIIPRAKFFTRNEVAVSIFLKWIIFYRISLSAFFFFFFMLYALRQSGQKNLIPYFFRVKLEINLTISFPTVVVYNFSEIEANFTEPNFSVIALWHVFLSLNEQCNVCIFLLLRILAKTCRVNITDSSKNVFGNFAKDRYFSIFQISLPKHVHMGCKFQGT